MMRKSVTIFMFIFVIAWGLIFASGGSGYLLATEIGEAYPHSVQPFYLATEIGEAYPHSVQPFFV